VGRGEEADRLLIDTGANFGGAQRLTVKPTICGISSSLGWNSARRCAIEAGPGGHPDFGWLRDL
jgi:hypothetical protein